MDLIRDEIECPVCLNVFDDKIFQCKDGHTVCGLCIPKIKDGRCPQCRLDLIENGKIRNRMMESILDKVNLDCPHADAGCPEKFSRKDVTKHGETCRFGHVVEYCKLLGFSECALKVPTVDAHSILPGHLKAAHGCVIPQGVKHLIKWNHFYQLDHPQRMHPKFQLMQLQDNSPVILLMWKIQDDSACWTCIRMDSVKDQHDDIVIEISSMENSEVKYSIPAIPVKDAEQFLKRPPFKLSIPYLTYLHSNKQYNSLQFTTTISSGAQDVEENQVAVFINPEPEIVLYSDISAVQREVRVPLGMLVTGRRIRIQGCVPAYAASIYATLETADMYRLNEQYDFEVPLSFACWFDNNSIVRSCHYRHFGWAELDDHTPIFPLFQGAYFDILIECDANRGYMVHINGEYCFHYNKWIAWAPNTDLIVADAMVSKISMQ